MGRRTAAVVAVALAGLVMLLVGGQTATGGGRKVVTDTDVSIVKVADDAVSPFERPEEGEAVHFRVAVTSEGPAKVKRGELMVLAEVHSIAKPSIRGADGLRCLISKDGDAWLVKCVNTGPFRTGRTTTVTIRVKAAGSQVSVRAGAVTSDLIETDLVVLSRKDAASITVADGAVCHNPWHGDWKRIEHAGTMKIVQIGGTIQSFSYDWFGTRAQFFDLKLSASGRSISGKDRTPAGRPVSFHITLATGGQGFGGTWSYTDAAGAGGGFSATRIGSSSCPGG